MKRISVVFWMLAIAPSCENMAPRARLAVASTASADDERSGSPLKQLSLSDLFDDIESDQERFAVDIFAKPTGKMCELHDKPIFRKNGFLSRDCTRYAQPYYTYLGLAEIGGYCPNSSYEGSDSIDMSPSGEGAEPYAIEYCRACNYVHQIGADRFSRLPDAEKTRWEFFLQNRLKESRNQHNKTP